MDNPLKKFFSSSNLFGGGSGSSAVGIDIGSSADLDNGRVTNLTSDKVIEALKEVLKQSGVTSNSVALSIPVRSSLIFTIELPSQIKESEIASIIPTEARKYIPVPITEVSLDYFVLPKKEASFEEANNPDIKVTDQTKTEVLVVAIQNEAVAKYRSLVSECALEAGFFEIEIFSSIRANFEHELSPVLLMDFGASSTKLSIVEFGTVKSFHIINRGGADISDAVSKSLSIPFSKAEEMKREFGLFENPMEKSLPDIIKIHTDYIFSETNNVLLGYEKKYGRAISKVIFSGGGSLLKGLKEIAVDNFKAEIEIGHPFSKVGAPAFLEKVLSATGPEFAIAIGLALRKLQ